MLSNEKREPLFYINQPNISYPEINMQKVYYAQKTKTKQKESEPAYSESAAVDKAETLKEEKKEVERKIASLVERQEVMEKYENKQEVSENPFTKEKKSSFKRLKSFKEMNLMERLDYLEHFPKQLPPVACIFEGNNLNVKGFLVRKTDSIVEIKKFDNTVEQVSISDLRFVKMVGLR
jgi:Spore coat protein CotO